jgi:hypothetical protein
MSELECVILPGLGELNHGNAIQSMQATSNDTNAPLCNYWAWRFDRTNDMSVAIMITNFWTKSVSRPCRFAGQQCSNRDPTIGPINGPTDVELVVDPYFPNTIPSVDSTLKGRTIHAGGRCRIFLDGHVQFLKDARILL